MGNTSLAYEMNHANVTIDNSTIGFPRMGPNRELKFSLEKYWRNKISQTELIAVANSIEEDNWLKQAKAGISNIGIGMFSLYDHVLDWTQRLGCEAKRFCNINEPLDRYFSMARGKDGIPAADMTKWFDTNYHYEVPEFDETTNPSEHFDSYLKTINRAIQIVGIEKVSPIILGPLTYLSISKYSDGMTLEKMLYKILPLYNILMNKLAELGIKNVQIHEPSLVTSKANELIKFLNVTYGGGNNNGYIYHKNININLVTYFDQIDENVYQWFLTSTISCISLDFTRGNNLKVLKKYGFVSGKKLGCGIIDGRSIWKIVPEKTKNILFEIMDTLKNYNNIKLSIQPSSSLQHVPYTKNCEKKIAFNRSINGLIDVLSFAYEKLDEINLITQSLKDPNASVDTLNDATKAWIHYKSLNPKKENIWMEISNIEKSESTYLNRDKPFDQRRPLQLINLPILPTTTIGSFPQTAAIRSLRRKLKEGQITLEFYQKKIDEQIAFNMGIQEALGLDILVHGEPERTDMVEYFGEKLVGYAFTENGWVQSYGSRCVRPPIIYADLERLEPMTVREFIVAQSFTSKPVKGMLTGPVTILNWSFPRCDISRKEQAYQLAMCLRKEIKDLEEANCVVIQVDEPALREGMPLRDTEKEYYLKWAVDAFRLSTAGAKNETSIHTHMCYAEFHDCMHAIDALDADVNSIENARSDDETIRDFKRIGYTRDLGPGTYDIHSPVVPPKEDIIMKLQSFLKLLPAKQIVVNPDCGLKTRKWPETIAALKNMVEATIQVRQKLSDNGKN